MKRTPNALTLWNDFVSDQVWVPGHPLDCTGDRVYCAMRCVVKTSDQVWDTYTRGDTESHSVPEKSRRWLAKKQTELPYVQLLVEASIAFIPPSEYDFPNFFTRFELRRPLIFRVRAYQSAEPEGVKTGESADWKVDRRVRRVCSVFCSFPTLMCISPSPTCNTFYSPWDASV